MAYQERIPTAPAGRNVEPPLAGTQPGNITSRDDPRMRFEVVDGVLYPYAGPAGDPSRPVPCEDVDGVLYPYAEEGAPVVQGVLHGQTVQDWLNMVTGLLLDWPDVGIYSDVYLLWEKKQPKLYAPDLFVLPRVRKLKRKRQSVYQWKEPSRAVFALEVLSDSNDDEDPDEKFIAYQDRGKIDEYFLCDPRPDPKQVWGFRLEGGIYRPIEPDRRGRLLSQQLGGWFGLNEAGQVQVWNESGESMPRYADALRELREARLRVQQLVGHADLQVQRAEEEMRKREAAEARIRELEEELGRRPH